MLKQGGGTSMFGRKNWLARYFVLRGDRSLVYYKDRKSYLAGAQPLKNASLDVDACKREVIKSDSGAVRIVVTDTHSGKHLTLSAARPDPNNEFEGWIEVLGAT